MIPRASGLVRKWGRVWSASRNALLKMESVAPIHIRREGQCLHERTPLVVNRNSPSRPIVAAGQRTNQTRRGSQSRPQHVRRFDFNPLAVEHEVYVVAKMNDNLHSVTSRHGPFAPLSINLPAVAGRARAFNWIKSSRSQGRFPRFPHEPQDGRAR